LTYSLKIGERWVRDGGTDAWPAQEVYATTPWNYGILVDGGFQAIETGATADQPFTPDGAPVALKAKGRRIPEWKLEPNGMIGEVQPGPVRSTQPVEEITLIPMGAARLRITAFPRIADNGAVWDGPAPMVFASAAGHYEPPSAALDGLAPANSADRSVPRFVWPGAGSRWIEYRWSEPRSIAWSEVYWAEDANVALPSSWRVEWLDGAAWRPVDGVATFPVEKDKFNRVAFSPVKTAAIRVSATTEGRRASGILEWKVGQ
jgi:hypothetical protein